MNRSNFFQNLMASARVGFLCLIASGVVVPQSAPVAPQTDSQSRQTAVQHPHVATHHRRHAGTKTGVHGKQNTATAKPKAPTGPKTAADLQNDLTAQLHAGRLTADAINVAVEGKVISLTGAVHRAEHKGLATRQARAVARKDGWTDYHVDNRLDVQSPVNLH